MHRMERGLGLALVAAAILLPDLARALETQPLDGARLAYIDPGSGSFILQALVAGLAAAVVAVTSYWSRIKRFFGGGPAKTDREETEDTKPHAD